MFLSPACVCSAPLSCPPDGELEGENRKVAFPQQLPATCGTLKQEWGFTRQKTEERDFPGGPVVKNLPSNAGDAGWIPGWGTKIPHARGQLSHTLQLVEPMSCNEDPVKPKARKRREESREKQQTLKPRAPRGVFRQERGGLSVTSQMPSTYLQPGSSNQRGPQSTLSSAILS